MSIFKIQTYQIPSSSVEGKVYAVARDHENNWVCSCPLWIHRLRELGEDCHHIVRAKRGFISRRPEITFGSTARKPWFDRQQFVLNLPSGDRSTRERIEDALFLLDYGYSKTEIWKQLDLPKTWTIERMVRYLTVFPA